MFRVALGGGGDQSRLRNPAGPLQPVGGPFCHHADPQKRGSKLSPLELATRLSITTGTVTGLLDGLQRAALIKRKTDPTDRRKLIITLTAQGKRVVDDVFVEHTAWISGMIQDLPPGQRQALAESIYCLSASQALDLATKAGR